MENASSENDEIQYMNLIQTKSKSKEKDKECVSSGISV